MRLLRVAPNFELADPAHCRYLSGRSPFFCTRSKVADVQVTVLVEPANSPPVLIRKLPEE